MPLNPNFVERRLIRSGVVPGVLVDVQLAATLWGALIGAMELGLFEVLEPEALDLETLAERTGASRRGLAALVDALEPVGYLEREDGRVALSRAARRLPLGELAAMAPFYQAQIDILRESGDLLRTPPEPGAGFRRLEADPDAVRAFHVTMRWLASLSVDEVARRLPLPDGARRLLDVGGGHGLYTVRLCERHAELRATILDRESGLESARRTLADHPGVADRIELLEGDLETDVFPEGQDVVFLGNIVHGLSPEANRDLFARIAGATNPGGEIAIVDQVAGAHGSDMSRAVAGLIGFNLYAATGGRAYPLADLAGWLAGAGYGEVRRKRLRAPGISLLLARKTV